MKPLLLLAMLVATGAATGGGAALAIQRFAPAPTVAATHAPPPAPPREYVAVERILAPLVMRDGRLAGYVSFDIGLDVAIVDSPAVVAQLPMLRHAINMRTYRTPLAAGPDGLLPDIDGLRRLVMSAAPEALGRGVVRRVAITRAEPT